MSIQGKSTDRDDYQRIPQRVGAMPREFSKGFHNAPHSHERAQLIYACSGVMEVHVGRQQWVLSPSTALLVPPMVEHEMRALTSVSMRTLFIHPDAGPLPVEGRASLIRVTRLLQELILEAVALPMGYSEDEVAGKIVDLILYEMGRHRIDEFILPETSDLRLRYIEQEIMVRPCLLAQSIGYWADQMHCSAKTLNRLIHRHLSVSFREWKLLLTVKLSLVLLAQELPLTQIAYELGYTGLSSFSRMFKKVTGKSPSSFVA